MSKEMTPIEMQSLSNTVRGMSEDQLRVVAQNMPVNIMCEEISRRYDSLVNKMANIMDVMNGL